MGVDFISHDIRTKPDRVKQEEFLKIILLERVMEYTFGYISCNSILRRIRDIKSNDRR